MKGPSLPPVDQGMLQRSGSSAARGTRMERHASTTVPSELREPDTSIKFVFFGCWNNPYYKLKGGHRSPRDIVLDKVYEEIKTNTTQALVIAGDNIYGRKEDTNTEKKTVYYDSALNVMDDNPAFTNNRISGSFVRLFALGNHNIESNAVYSAVKKRLDRFKPAPQVHDPLEYYPHVYMHQVTSPAQNACVAIVVIDTNVFSKIPKQSLKSYRDAFKLSGEVNSADLRTVMCERIQSHISKAMDTHDLKHLVIVGHHPIAYFDHKDSNAKLKTDMEHAGDLIRAMHKGIGKDPKVSVTYMCADRHNFQDSNLKFRMKDGTLFSIKQIVAGTAGAQPDIFIKAHIKANANSRGVKLSGTILDETGDIQIFAEARHISNSYGYCKVEIKPSGRLYCNYVKTVINHNGPSSVTNANNYQFATHEGAVVRNELYSKIKKKAVKE